jgi:hypothetical protein
MRLGPVVASLAALTAALAVYAAYKEYMTEALSTVCQTT